MRNFFGRNGYHRNLGQSPVETATAAFLQSQPQLQAQVSRLTDPMIEKAVQEAKPVVKQIVRENLPMAIGLTGLIVVGTAFMVVQIQKRMMKEYLHDR